MKLGKHFGITAPMFVLHFEDVNAGAEFLRRVALQYPNETQLLKYEFIQLLKIKQLSEYKVNTEVPSEIDDDRWDSGKLVLHPDWTSVISQQFNDAVKARLLNTGFKSNQNLVDEAVNNYLQNETFELHDLKRNILSCSRIVQGTEKQELSGAGISYELKDTVVVDGKRHQLTLEERKVLNYFLNRLDDVKVFIDSITSRKGDAIVFNTSLSRFVTRKPSALYYVIADKLSGLCNCYDDASFTHILDVTKDALQEYKTLFKKHVRTHDESSALLMDFTAEEKALLDSVDYTTPELYSNEVNQFILEIARIANELDHNFLSEKFGFDTDWNAFGYKLCKFGLFGINESTQELLKNYLANFISFEISIYLDDEELNSRKKAIEDVECLFTTYQPFGMEI